MTFPSIVRRSSLVAALNGAAWTFASLLTLVIGEPIRFLDFYMVLPLALLLVAVMSLHDVQRESSGRLGRVGYWLVVVATPLMLIGQLGLALDIDLVTIAFLIPGMAAWILGLLLFGIATVRARVLPAALGVAIALSQGVAVLAGFALAPIVPISNSGTYTGAIGHGVIWLCVALALRSRQHAPDRATAAHGAALPQQ